MTSFKKTILFMHRWLGFITGLVVFIVSVTGCIFCFQDEIQDAVHSYRKVEFKNGPYLAPSVLKQTALKSYPGGTANYIYYYGKDRPAAVLVNEPKLGLQYVFMNPYTGLITHTENPQTNFFIIVEYIHLYLLLPPKIGSLIVGISVILFVLIMITGIVLWWPKRKTDRKRSFTIKWNGRWRRVNYDLHNVLGFYATGVAIILAVTGLSITFNWMRDGIYNTANQGKIYTAEKTAPKSDSLLKVITKGKPVIDRAFAEVQNRSPAAQMFLIYEDNAMSGAVGVTAYAKTLHYYKSDSYTFDKYSGRQLQYLPHTSKSPGMKMNDMNYDIHVGQILGITGKIIAFSASLICAGLPATGFIIWFGKRKKSNKRKHGAVISHPPKNKFAGK
ncbi:PepSY-associated TM helix domain-containing protein [Mucilaginibacter xinganensis]|uniref:Peptidase n=1 Tax=Mucilaginibacter xinganensis TaxID=1234841 RepID=A0A223P0H5_9SPHI|nr:PepSY-associated TM helix domain-containing protein [Mucilaginibacter xinganensis]ASU35586.1 hypothetical protein MuYL_3701 [Mucilaginibacter xinganensis]